MAVQMMTKESTGVYYFFIGLILRGIKRGIDNMVVDKKSVVKISTFQRLFLLFIIYLLLKIKKEIRIIIAVNSVEKFYAHRVINNSCF